MPSYNSKDGVWKPATERVALYDKNGDPHIYEGPDRAALQYMKEQGVEHLGKHFSEDPDIINRAHERKMTVDEFCKTKIHTKEKREEQFKKNESEKVNHKLPEKSQDKTKYQSGGKNTAGTGGDLTGGFGSDSVDATADAIQKTQVK